MDLALLALGRWLELLLRCSLALALLVAAALLGRELVGAVTRGVRVGLALRLAGTGLGAAWVFTVSFHVLGSLGRFDLVGATVLVLLGFSVGLRPGARAGREIRREALVALRWVLFALRRRPVLALVPAVALLLALRALLLPPLAWDTLTYHLPKAAIWVQSGRAALFDAPGGWSAYRAFSGGGEVLWAWAMLPFGGDLLVGLADVAAWAGFAFSIYLLGRRIGLRSSEACISAAFVAAIPAPLLAAGAAYVDNLGHAFAALGVVYMLLFLRRDDPAFLAPAGMGLGLAAGVKFTALPLVGLLVAVIALAALGPARARPGFARGALLGLALAAAACVPWFVRNGVESGFPFSPYPIRVGSLTLGENAAFSWYLQQPAGPAYALGAEWNAFSSMLHTPLKDSLGGFPLLPLVLAPLGLAVWWRRQRAAAALGLVLLLHAGAVYLSPQFSVTRLRWAENNARYFLLAVALATCLGFLATARRSRVYAAFLLAGTAFNLWVYGALGWGPHEVTLVLGHLALLLALIAFGVRLAPRGAPLRAALTLALLAGFLAHAAAWRSAWRYQLMAEGMSIHPVPKYWLGAARAVDSPREAYRIAVTSGPYAQADNWLTYPLLGSRLQNTLVYVPLSRSGEVLAANDPRYLAEADRQAWLERLVRTRAAAVMSFLPAGPELGWMESDPERFARAAGDGKNWGLYVVRPRPAP